MKIFTQPSLGLATYDEGAYSIGLSLVFEGTSFPDWRTSNADLATIKISDEDTLYKGLKESNRSSGYPIHCFTLLNDTAFSHVNSQNNEKNNY